MRLYKVDFAAFMSKVRLPEGWSWEPWDKSCVVLIPPAALHGHVTIDTRHRRIELGFVTPTAKDDEPKYGGRGWRQNMVNDAVALLVGNPAAHQ